MREARCFKMASNCRVAVFVLMVSIFSFVNSVSGSPVWPSFTKRNVQALARDGLLTTRVSHTNDDKRSIATLAKNGLLPTLTAPEEYSDEEDEEEEMKKKIIESLENIGSYDQKRNTGTLARNGVRAGKRFYDEKRNIGSLARNGYLKNDQDVHKRESSIEDEYYFPFYQNSISPVTELDYPQDYSELYELPKNTNSMPTSADYLKRNIVALLRQNAYKMIANNPNYLSSPENDDKVNLNKLDKRQSIGMPNHGLYRTRIPVMQLKRYIISIPEPSDEVTMQDYDEVPETAEKRSVDTLNEPHENYDKRHIGALARKYSPNTDVRVGKHFTDSESISAADTDDADLPPPAVSINPYGATRGKSRPIISPFVYDQLDKKVHENADYNRFINAIAKNRWERDGNKVKFYNFRSLKIPRHYQGSMSEKRYLLLPALDNIMLRKTYPNNNLPSRRKNQ